MSSNQTSKSSLDYGEANADVLNSCLPDVVPKLPTSFNSLVSPYDPSTWVNIPPLSTDKQANFKDDSFITTASTLMNTTVNFINGSESNNWSKIEAGQSFESQKSKKKKTQQNNAFDLSSSFVHGSKDAMMRPKNKEGLTLFNECAIYLGDYIEKPEQTNSELIESLIKRKVVESMNGDIHLTTNNFGTVSYERTLFISKSKQYVHGVGKGANEEEAKENCSWKLLQRLYSLGVIQEYSFEFGRAKTTLAKAASNTIDPRVSVYCDLTTETLEDFIHFLSM